MTTTITVKTHDWPVEVSKHTHSKSESPLFRTWTHGSSSEFLAAHSEASFSVTDTCTISVRELPKEATELEKPNFPPLP